jgi:4-amino-4-deoxy-L-arabinose transferase-like glycosyltransferase
MIKALKNQINEVKIYFLKNKKEVLLLSLIIIIGIFLRTYHFHDWLRFNADQSRDAAIVSNVIEGNENIPLYGPKAGGTEFRLGPAFYYFQLISAKIFGTSPDKMAYPDLLFSVLSIPLLYLIARIFFNKKISLTLALIYALSYFNIKYSRFAWNPNSTSFFVMLYFYAICRFIGENIQNRKLFWMIIAGIAMGIGMQLHTSLLIILPILTCIIIFYLIRKKIITGKYILVFAVAVLFLNIPQIVAEIKDHGNNIQQFWLGSAKKNARNVSIGGNLLLDITCHVEANFYILTSLGDKNICGYKPIIKKIHKLDNPKKSLQDQDKEIFISILVASVLISGLGYFLFFRSNYKEKEASKKIILFSLSTYIILAFILFVAVANELSIRFFLILGFIPFLLLGFCMKYLAEKTKKEAIIIALVILTLSFTNIKKISAWNQDLVSGSELNGNFEYITLGEAEHIVNYLNKHKVGKTVIIDAQAGYLFKFIKSLQFLAKKKNFEIVEYSREMDLKNEPDSFYVKSAKKGCVLPSKKDKNFNVENCSLYGQFAIFTLKAK